MKSIEILAGLEALGTASPVTAQNAVEVLQAENDRNRKRLIETARDAVADLRRLAGAIENAVASESVELLADIIPMTFTQVDSVRRAAYSVVSLDKLLARVRKDGPR